VEVFFNLADARRKLALWRHDYNHHRPHSALADRTPSEFAAICSGGKDAGFACLKNDIAVFHYWNGPPQASPDGLSWLA